MTGNQQLTTFRVAGQHFGVDVQKVQEVLRPQAITRVPLAPAVVTGLINLRGQIVTAIDLRRRLGLAEQGGSPRAMNVIVRTDGDAVSLLVDHIGEVIAVERELFEPVPETVPASVRELVTGVYKLPDRLLLVLDTERVLSPAAARS